MTNSLFMRRALALARRGRPSPNPKVGALVVKDGLTIGSGYHPRAGEPHAEVFALEQAGEAARGADLYVTLEPCPHLGRTPPCTELIIRAGIRRAYAAMADPDPNVSGEGLKRLREAGVEVYVGLCEDKAREINEGYIKHRTTGLPLVILKSAVSLDGKIATHTGDSKWITGERARAFAHRLRREADAVVVGANTVRADDPALTARLGRKTCYPTRVVLTASGRLPDTMKMLAEPGETIIATTSGADRSALGKLEAAGARIMVLEDRAGRPSIAHLTRELAALGHLSVLIEGGGEIAASAFEERVVDKIVYFYSSKVIGGREAPGAVGGAGVPDIASAITVEGPRLRRFGPDFAVEGRVVYVPSPPTGEGQGKGDHVHRPD